MIPDPPQLSFTVFNSGFKMLQTPPLSQEHLPPDSPDSITVGLNRISVMQKVTYALLFISAFLAYYSPLTEVAIADSASHAILQLVRYLIFHLIIILIPIYLAKNTTKMVNKLTCEFPSYGDTAPKDLRNTNKVIKLCSLFAVIDALLIIGLIIVLLLNYVNIVVYSLENSLESILESISLWVRKTMEADSTNFIPNMIELFMNVIIMMLSMELIFFVLDMIAAITAATGNIMFLGALSGIKKNLTEIRDNLSSPESRKRPSDDI